MILKNGQQVIAENMKSRLTVQKKLGEGGQGVVYLVNSGSDAYAFKHYHAEFGTPEQRDILLDLIQQGAPAQVSRKFVWPLDVVNVADGDGFGYLMPLIDMDRYAEIGHVWGGRKPAPQYDALCEITYQVAECYRRLHAKGYCYRDINKGNVVFDPSSGDVLICDNDNVGVNNHSQASILGTWEFMPPELILQKANPSTATDLHMLAVWLFYLWVWHHPLHGEIEASIRSWDLIAKRVVYGTDPVFIFNTRDTRNRLPPEYTTPDRQWKILPESLKKLFTKAFTEGLRDPDRRVTDGEWRSLATQLNDNTLVCPKCRAIVLWEQSVASPACWNCKAPVSVPPMAIFPQSNRLTVTLIPGRKILPRHADDLQRSDQAQQVLGEVVQNPQNPGVWGIRNQTPYTWIATMPDGVRKDVLPQKAVPLVLGAEVQLPGSHFRIIAKA
jgi:eukaryotic-like serine/threonine-protein kinase